jgi:hypothetical protein
MARRIFWSKSHCQACGLRHIRHDLDSANQGFTICSFTDWPLAAFDWDFTSL